MATLTGYKAVTEQQQQQQNGQTNPVFVFDDVDGGGGGGGGGATDSGGDQTEVFVDAPTHPEVLEKGQQQQTAQAMKRKMIAATNEQQVPAGGAVAIVMNSEPQTPPTLPQKTTVSQERTKAPASATGKQLQKGAITTTVPITNTTANQQQQRPPSSQNSLSPDQAGGDGDNVSVSMLAIDCAGTGKSPRTPRRSPLMALFRGKPRESVRRLYTDEDQFEIEWANMSLEVQQKWYQRYSMSGLLGGGGGKPEKPKLILNSVDGRIKSGEITAVLGPSGAGKTSLLNCLFGKYRTAIQGSIRVTGAPSKKHLTVCTIPQSDYLIGYLTTEESLWFASRLKNCEHDFNHDRNIERVTELLGLQRCRHTRINKLSGGQYKRVSIAQEMLSSPDILVLDEPTSGLDSLTCYRTVKVLRDLVEASKAHNLVNPMSIILTIHQPHREVLDLFHSVYVMAVGGQTMFQGAPNEMEETINKFSGTTVPAQGYNPASFMVELASEEYGRKPIDALVGRQKERFAASRRTNHSNNSPPSHGGSQLSLNNSIGGGGGGKTDSTINLYPLETGGGRGKGDKYVDIDLQERSNNQKKAGQNYDKTSMSNIDSRIMTPRSGKNSDGVFWRHVSLMARRCFLSNTRDPLLCTIRVGAHIFIPLVVALIYGPKMGIPNGCPFYKPEINLLEYASMGVEEIQEKHDDIRIQFQNVGLHFMVYYAFGLCMLAFTAISFPLIMHVLIKEIRNGWYSLATFILGKMFAELPMAFVLPPISVAIIYTMTGQPASEYHWRYMVQSLLLILIVMIAEAKGLIFGSLFMNSMQTAVFAASVSTVPFILLSGFLIRIREVPYVLQHLAKFSYFKHSVEALIITRYGFGMCPCDPSLIPPGGTPRIIGIPSQFMSLTDYYISAYIPTAANSNNGTAAAAAESEPPVDTNLAGNNRNINRIVESITTLSPEIDIAEGAAAGNNNNNGEARRTRRAPPSMETAMAAAEEEKEQEDGEKPVVKQGIFFDKLATLLTRANAFGFSIQSCKDVEPFTMKDMVLSDDMLAPLIGYLFLYIVILKFISYFIVEICVKLKL